MTWILIIMLSGWGAGMGYQGNAIGSVEFDSKTACELARTVITRGLDGLQQKGTRTFCVPKE